MIMDYEYFSQYANKAAMFAPCTVTAESMYALFKGGVLEKILDWLDVWVVGGPDWYIKWPSIAQHMGKRVAY